MLHTYDLETALGDAQRPPVAVSSCDIASPQPPRQLRSLLQPQPIALSERTSAGSL
jgi:hypothetical protein